MASASARPWPWQRQLPCFDSMATPRCILRRCIEQYKARSVRLKITIPPQRLSLPPQFRQFQTRSIILFARWFVVFTRFQLRIYIISKNTPMSTIWLASCWRLGNQELVEGSSTIGGVGTLRFILSLTAWYGTKFPWWPLRGCVTLISFWRKYAPLAP